MAGAVPGEMKMKKTNPAVSDSYRLIRAYFESLQSPVGGNYMYHTPAKWRELAKIAHAMADECEAVASKIEASKA